MRKHILFLLGVLIPLVGIATPRLPVTIHINVIQHPVYWKYRVKKMAGRMYELHLTAFIRPGWHLYAQQQPGDAIAMPTSIQFKDNPQVTFSGSPKEIGALEEYTDPALGISARQYEGTVDFVQVVRLKKDMPAVISGSILFQTCTDEECLPPATTDFNIIIKE